jgi:hypothetical protein
MKVAEELRYLILAIQREGNRLLAAELRPLGVTPSQAEVLRVLRDHGPLTLSALGGLLVAEEVLHKAIDELVAGQPVGETITTLRAVAAAFPAGEALARRREKEN